jgi:hypothetical protein
MRSEPVFARDGIPLNPGFVIPEPIEGSLDVMWECIACEIQQLEFNLKPGLMEFPPPGWRTILRPDDDEAPEDAEYLCPTCVKLPIKWI